MIKFEWDAKKAAGNRRKHGVSFELAARVFQDAFAVEWIDQREAHGEERTIILGMAAGIIMVVVYTERGDRIRIVSARRATRHEQDLYYRENGA